MEAKNSSNLRNNTTKPQRPVLSTPKITDLKHIPIVPKSDQELKDIVRRAFPFPSVRPSVTSSILERIHSKKSMPPE